MSNYLRVKIRGMTPPGGYRYTFPQDGHQIKCGIYEDFLNEVRKHYQRNAYEMPADWAEAAEDQCCRLMPAGVCMYGDGSEPEFIVTNRFGFDDVIRGTKTLAAWVSSGFPLVEQEVAEARANICSSCFGNVSIPGCTSCVNFAQTVSEVVGRKDLKADSLLVNKACAFCHCSSQANVWIPVEVSRHGLNPQAVEAMPSWCWKKLEHEKLLEKEASP
jgi:hypothetical protein